MKKLIPIIVFFIVGKITFAQNFGIDQPSPTEKLDVNGNLRVRGTVLAENNIRISTAGDAKFEYFGSSSDRGFIGWQSTGQIGIHLMNRDNTPIYFSTTNTERMRIDPVGNVGIGVTSPAQKLDVGGNIKASGIVQAGRTAQMWTAKRNGGVNSSGWTTIPGLSINFNLERSATVSVVANGVQRTGGTGSGDLCHQAYRMAVDGVAGGDPNHGERLVVTRGDVQWWANWSYAGSRSLPAGNHNISIQTRASSGGNCHICMEVGNGLPGYTDCDLIITAVYD